MKSILNHGQTQRYHHKYIGINGRMDTMQAAVLNVKLKYYNDELLKRQAAADKYTSELSGNIIKPVVKNDRTSVWAQYSIRTQNRNNVQGKLKDAGLPTAVHYSKPLHLQEAFANFGGKLGDYPVAEKVSNEIMSIPMSAFLKEEDQDYIIQTLNNLV